MQAGKMPVDKTPVKIAREAKMLAIIYKVKKPLAKKASVKTCSRKYLSLKAV